MSKNIDKMMVSPVFEKIRVKHSGSPKAVSYKDYRQSKRQVSRKVKYKRQERALNYGQTT